jgi:hypothetical protein
VMWSMIALLLSDCNKTKCWMATFCCLHIYKFG